MQLPQRQQDIVELLRVKKSVTVQQLCKKLYASAATIRRDLGALERQGLLRRTRGGAILFEGGNSELSSLTRQNEHRREKEQIGSLASYFIKDGYTVFMDSSSTVCAVVPFLESRITVVTNGLHCALALSGSTNCSVYMPAGRLMSRSNSLQGSDTLEHIGGYCADVALISCAGLAPQCGVTEVGVEQARIKRRMLERAKTKILLCDSSKLGRVCMSKICDVPFLDYVITDSRPDSEVEGCFSAGGCSLIYPGL